MVRHYSRATSTVWRRQLIIFVEIIYTNVENQTLGFIDLQSLVYIISHRPSWFPYLIWGYFPRWRLQSIKMILLLKFCIFELQITNLTPLDLCRLDFISTLRTIFTHNCWYGRPHVFLCISFCVGYCFFGCYSEICITFCHCGPNLIIFNVLPQKRKHYF